MTTTGPTNTTGPTVLSTDGPLVAEPVHEETPRHIAYRYTLAVTRLSLGWVFLWAFLDKTFGLGHETPSAGAWINGGSPTEGFLAHAPKGPFAGFYNDIAGAAWADWLFMIGLAGIGIALLLGVGMRVAAVSGAVLYLMMWAVVLPPETNPIVDEHVIGALALLALALVHAGDTFGFGRWWKQQPVVTQNRWLI